MRRPSIRAARLAAIVAVATTPFSFVAFEGDAQACGGCFHGEPPPDQPVEQSSVVTDHRMVFSVSTKQTVLWDQVRYTGDPGEFAWVLPIRAGARVELSNDEWLAALDATTATTIKGPTPRQCGGSGFGGGYDSESSGGCGGSSSSIYATDNASGSPAPKSELADGGSDVEVLKQEVVGPYEVVTLRSSVDDAIDKWLRANGFVIPPAIAPILRDYTADKFDFIALKLRPGQSVRAMQPVRIVTPGADTTMPLRMVAAGVGARVGLTLWVIGEGRYHTQNFPDAIIDFSKLTWDPVAKRSNYSLLAETELSKQEGRAWLTESSAPAALYYGGGLASAYKASCGTQPRKRVPCKDRDAGKPPPVPPLVDAGTTDAGASADADATNDASATTDSGDAGRAPSVDAGGCFETISACDALDDLDLVTSGTSHPDELWVTRLRAFLPVNALTSDLRLEAARSQTSMPNAHSTETYSDPSYDPCGGTSTTSGAKPPGPTPQNDEGCACTTASTKSRFGSFFLVGGTALAGAAALRRRRRRT